MWTDKSHYMMWQQALSLPKDISTYYTFLLVTIEHTVDYLPNLCNSIAKGNTMNLEQITKIYKPPRIDDWEVYRITVELKPNNGTNRMLFSFPVPDEELYKEGFDLDCYGIKALKNFMTATLDFNRKIQAKEIELSSHVERHYDDASGFDEIWVTYQSQVLIAKVTDVEDKTEDHFPELLQRIDNLCQLALSFNIQD